MGTTKSTAMAWWGFLMVGVVMTTSFLVAASPVVSPSPPAEKEKMSSALKNGKPANQQQQQQGLPSAKMPKGTGRMQSQGKSPKPAMVMDSSQAIPDQRPMKSDPAALAPSRPAFDRAPPSGQKGAEDGGKQRGRGPNVPGTAGLNRGASGGVGKGGGGGGGTSEGKIRGDGKGGGGREGSGMMGGKGGGDVRLKQLKGPPSSSGDVTGLRYFVGGSEDADGLQNGRPQQPSLVRGGSEDGLRDSTAVDRLSSFAYNDVPPLAMAEYLMLTGDFNGFDDALADIVAIGMMAPEEAEVYRDTVRLEYDSLLQQEAEADSEYQEADDVLQGGIQPFLPPFAIEYPDYSYYGNQAVDNGRGGPFSPSGFYGPGLKGDKLEEVLQQMLDSIASSYNVPDLDDRNGSNKSSSSSGIKTSSSTSSSSSSMSSSTLEDQLKSLDLPIEKQAKGKTGGSKGGAGKGGAGKGKGGGGKGAGGGGGKGGGGGGKGRKQDAKQPDAEKELKSLASQVPQNKTKEANSTKSRRPPSKQEQPTPP